ncbi:helix-turn-helix domain-containing protein [Streptomyces sp. NPDC047971]|uniref:helix-turn-helix transcriptional regulator n=1 Tax=Streptomyces sp. NPDC047971 TaxID=3154499 RepID=UPI0033CC200E
MPHEPASATNPAAPHADMEATAHPTLHCQGDPTDSRPLLLASAWYSTKDLATRLRIDASTLRRWRTTQPPQGPPFISISERVVMYNAADIEEWLRSRRIAPSQAA